MSKAKTSGLPAIGNATFERYAEWVLLYHDGMKMPAIAAMYGVSKQAIHNGIRQYLQHAPVENAEGMRRLQNLRLERDLQVLYTRRDEAWEAGKDTLGNRLQEMILRVYRRQGELNGLDRNVNINANFNFEGGVIPIRAADYREDLKKLAPPDMVEGEYEFPSD